MYYKYFGFEGSPFSIAPDPSYLYLSSQHREALAHLLYGIESGGFVLLTGEVGTGKTTVSRSLLKQLPANCDVALLLNPRLDAAELLASICDEWSISYPEGNTSNKVFLDAINRHLLSAHAQGRNTLLMVDEAQNLSPAVLEQLRLLTNLETEAKKLLQIILIGQPELRDQLASRELRQLDQRITARYHIGPLSRSELRAYVEHRLAVAGGAGGLFTPAAVRLLYQLSRGIPRVINLICDRALLGAYAADQRQVTGGILLGAAREVLPQVVPRWLRLRVLLPAAAAACILVFLAAWLPAKLPLLAALLAADSSEVRVDAPVSPPLAEPLLPPPRPQPLLPAAQQLSAEDAAAAAYLGVFSRWNADYQPLRDARPCRHARRLAPRLLCLSGQGSMETLRSYNRPAILEEVRTDDGRIFSVALMALRDEEAVLLVGRETHRVPLSALSERWQGGYTLLWQPPEPYIIPVKQGDTGPMVVWLAASRARLEGEPVHPAWVLEGELLDWVIRFQAAHGLKTDGKVGPYTLLYLQNELGAAEPALTIR